ncbi:hypothetical protein LNTAR_21700 [Lentisphaera araneosa HTCC2155]|uniref:Uncharacterized protein n=1 Tax=Lentisphaera araneosa HTCC2155 TaxID=313628 RepID=A6DM74_9BACT|nr:hypothetical protein LNTAR_21700 [Lentisphaera araneosa HTCC2155]
MRLRIDNGMSFFDFIFYLTNDLDHLYSDGMKNAPHFECQRKVSGGSNG